MGDDSKGLAGQDAGGAVAGVGVVDVDGVVNHVMVDDVVDDDGRVFVGVAATAVEGGAVAVAAVGGVVDDVTDGGRVGATASGEEEEGGGW